MRLGSAFRFFVVPFLVACFVLSVALTACADDVSRVRDAIKRSTLDQPGTKPFHLKATLAPTYDRDRDSGRTGEVEIWWASPTRYKREVRSPEFHQIEIVDGVKRWQKNEGKYFPEWLRNIAVELIRPVPDLDGGLKGVAEADVKRLMGSTYYSWQRMSTDGKVQKGMGATIAITDSTGLLFYGSAAGWGGIFHDYQKFQGRMVARTVGAGTPEITAKIQTLEELGAIPDSFFSTDAPGGDAQPIDTVVVDELTMRKNLITPLSIAWPALRDGPLEGVLTTDIVVDRDGNVRDVGSVVSDNPALEDATQEAISKLQFKPYLQNGVPVQVITRLTMPFKTGRPEQKHSTVRATISSAGANVISSPPQQHRLTFSRRNIRHKPAADKFKREITRTPGSVTRSGVARLASETAASSDRAMATSGINCPKDPTRYCFAWC